jgi:hypothetical protein
MVAPASYGWNLTLHEAVPDGGTVDIPAHDINENVDQESVELAVDGDVIAEDEFEAAFDVASEIVTITNMTGEAWDEQSNVYVSARRKPLTGENIGGDTSALEARIGTLEGQVATMSAQLDNHEARISALETPVARR